MSHLHPKSEVLLVGDIRNILRGLAASTAGMIDNEFRTGYLAALVAVAVTFGAVDEDDSRSGTAFLLPPGGRQ